MRLRVDPISAHGALAASAAEVLTRGAPASEQGAVQATLREVERFCERSVSSLDIDRRQALGDEVLSGARALGLFGLSVDEEHGGAGLSPPAAAAIVEALARRNGSLATCIGLHNGLGLHALRTRGDEALRRRYLPACASGERIASFAATEPSAGSDIASMRTTLSERGGALRLSGSKCYVTNGGIAGLFTVVARSPGLGSARAGHTVVLVDPAWPGVQRGREEHKLGLKGSSTITIDLDDVEVPRDHVLGEPSQGLSHAYEALAWGRTMLAAGCVGTARGALDEARAHVQTRTQFGRPLSAFALVRDQLADALADLFTIESVVRLAASSLAGQGDPSVITTIAKIAASEGASAIVDRSLQLMGGAGYIEEAGVARRLRDVRVTRIFEGANDVLRLHLGAEMLSWAPRERAPEAAVEGPLAAAAQALCGCEARLFDIADKLRASERLRWVEQQERAVLLADAVVSLFGARSALSRALADPDGASSWSLAELAIERSHGSAERALDALSSLDLPSRRARAQAIVR